VDAKNPFIPKFPVLNGVNIYDPATYTLGFASTENDSIFERDVVGDVSLNKQYSVGSHLSSFEVGFKGWDARKTQRYDRETFNLSGAPMSQFLSSFKDNSYYFGNYTYGPVTDFQKILAAVQPGGTTPNQAYNLQNAFDISERIWAGYAMNTISASGASRTHRTDRAYIALIAFVALLSLRTTRRTSRSNITGIALWAYCSVLTSGSVFPSRSDRASITHISLITLGSDRTYSKNIFKGEHKLRYSLKVTTRYMLSHEESPSRLGVHSAHRTPCTKGPTST